jgi:molybdopterin synthase catalytic subunit
VSTDILEGVREPFRMSGEPLTIDDAVAQVVHPSCGAIATFVGTTRETNAGRRVLWLDYEAYTPLALRSFEQIGAEAERQWPGIRLAIHHRTGRVAIGDPSVVIAAASPHRAPAFAAARYAIERLKQIAPIWKREHFDGGEVWIEGAAADPRDETAQQEALAKACS